MLWIFTIYIKIDSKTIFKERQAKCKIFIYNSEEKNKKSIIFIDDINMAHHDQFGASPVIEILREITDHLG